MRKEIVEELVKEFFEILSKLPEAGIKELETSLLKAYKKQEKLLIKNYNSLLKNPEDLAIEIRRLQQLKLFYETVDRRTSFILSPKNSVFSQQIHEIVEEIDVYLQEWSYDELIDILSDSSDLGDILAKDAIRIASQTDPQFGTVSIDFLKNIEDSRNRLFRYSPETASRIIEKISTNLLAGNGVETIKKELIQEIRLAAWKAEQLARTESAKILNEASKERYNNSNVEYGQWFSTPQEKYPCVFCASRTGNVYRLDEIEIPAHPSCYCFISPFSFDWEYDSKFISDYSRKSRKIAGIEDKDRQKYSLLPTPFERYEKKQVPIPIQEF